MPTPVPKKAAAQPLDLTDADLLDRTMELDVRWLQYEKEDDEKPVETSGNSDDPTIVLDLTATQVHDLLTDKNKKK